MERYAQFTGAITDHATSKHHFIDSSGVTSNSGPPQNFLIGPPSAPASPPPALRKMLFFPFASGSERGEGGRSRQNFFRDEVPHI